MVIGNSVHADGPGSLSEIQAAAVVHFSAGVLALRGEEAKDFLQRISTNNVARLAPGEVLQTVLTDEKGRIIDVVTAVNRGSSFLVMTSPGRSPIVKAWLEKYIIMEDIAVDDESMRSGSAIVIASSERLKDLASVSVADRGAEPTRVIPFKFHSVPAGLVLSSSMHSITAFLSAHSIPVMSPEVYDDFRIRFGIPEIGKEINDKTNPHEAGLNGLVDYGKGCYIGQEVIARLNTYEKVQRRLCRIRLSERPAEDENTHEIVEEDIVHGYITTLGHAVNDDGTVDTLAVLKTAAANVGSKYSLRGTTISSTVTAQF